MRRIDLHIHTSMSDGTLSPNEVIDMAVRNNVDVISITDHDNCDAYSEEFFYYAKLNNVKVITGVEISTSFNGIGVHILGYNLDINNKILKERLFSLRNIRHKYLVDVSIRLRELGYVLNFDVLDKVDAVTKAHIALDIINNPKNRKILLNEFGHIPNKGEFIETIMNKGCPAYVKKDTISPIDAASLIRNVGGKVVLAHPVAYCNESKLSYDDILSLIKEMRSDGIEANYIYINRNNIKINDSQKWNKVAEEYDLIATIGSDFHSDDGIHPDIGLINEELYLNKIDVDSIIKRLNN